MEPFFLYRKDRSWRSGKLKTAFRVAGIDSTISNHFKEHVGNNTGNRMEKKMKQKKSPPLKIEGRGELNRRSMLFISGI
ncbi:hypothetical protein DWZ69_09465 [Eubacterium sp. AF34-35BH]|nr:hypothetical protein DW006_08190 [Eubacterium sp. AF36-5BH]RHP20721.1 hypothetical protein DWZ69_09465 [Eubacterium sp. AF34-35BH]